MLGVQSNGGSLQLSTIQAINTLAALGIFATQGNFYFVNPNPAYGNDVTGDGSIAKPFASLGVALAAATAGQNDVIFLCASSNTASLTTNYLSSNLNWNKGQVHLIGLNAGPLLGQRSRIAPLSTATSFANLFTLSASGCLIANIEFFQGAGSTTLSAAQTCVTVSGQRNVFRNCQISGIGDSTVDYAGSNSLTISGGENRFVGCYIGLDTVIRATSVTEVIISGTPARIVFEDCHFETYTSGSTFKMLTVPTGADRFVLLTRCIIHAVQNITSSVAPTGAIGITTMNGTVLLNRCFLYGFAQYVTADNAYVVNLSDGFGQTGAGHLMGIAQTIDAA